MTRPYTLLFASKRATQMDPTCHCGHKQHEHSAKASICIIAGCRCEGFDNKAQYIAVMEFKCPKCAGSHYGSILQNDGKYERHCNGHLDGKRCGFTWNEVDDKKYMSPTGELMPIYLGKIDRGVA